MYHFLKHTRKICMSIIVLVTISGAFLLFNLKSARAQGIGITVEDAQCIGQETAFYTESVIDSIGNLPRIRYLTPVFNMTHPYAQQMFESYWGSLGGSARSYIDAIGGNAYNVAGTSVIADWVARFQAFAGGKDKPYMLTEVGWHEYAVCSTNPDDPPPPSSPCVDHATALARLQDQVGYMANSPTIVGAQFFSGYKTGGGEWEMFDIRGDIGALCANGACAKLGINSAGYLDSGFPFSSVSSDGMKYVLQISNGDPVESKKVIDAAFANDLTPVFRIGDTTGVGGGFEDPSVYADYLRDLNTYVQSRYPSDSTKVVYAILGPNEPESECWATPSCGCGLQGEDVLIPIKIKGTIKSNQTLGSSTNLFANGVVVAAYSGTWDSINPLAEGGIRRGVTGKLQGKIVNHTTLPDRCAVSGRRTTDPNGNLECEAYSVACDPEEENCAGRYELVTFITKKNYNGGNYISVFCNGENVDNYFVTLPKGYRRDLTLDLTVPCGPINVPYEAPAEVSFASSASASCDPGESYFTTPDLLRSTEFIASVSLEKLQVDGGFSGVSLWSLIGQIFGLNPELPEPSELATTIFETRASTNRSYSPDEIRTSVFFTAGSGHGYLPPHVESAPTLTPSCEAFRVMNTFKSVPEYPNYSAVSQYGYSIKLRTPGEAKEAYSVLRPGFKDLPVCMLPDGRTVRFGEIAPPGSTSTAGYLLPSSYFPHHLNTGGGDNTSIKAEGLGGVSNDTRWPFSDSDQADAPPRGEAGGPADSPFIYGQQLTDPAGTDGAGSERFRASYVPGFEKYAEGAFSLEKLRRIVQTERASQFGFPNAEENGIDYASKIDFDPRRVIRLGTPIELCTYNATSENRSPEARLNNEAAVRDETHPYASVGIYETDETLDDQSAFAFGMDVGPILRGLTLVNRFVNNLLSLFAFNLNNIDPYNPPAQCFPPEVRSCNAGDIGCVCNPETEPNCEFSGCYISPCPATGSCNCEDYADNPLDMCFGLIAPPAGSAVTCQFSEAGGYACLGDQRIVSDYTGKEILEPRIDTSETLSMFGAFNLPVTDNNRPARSCSGQIFSVAYSNEKQPGQGANFDNLFGCGYVQNIYYSLRALGLPPGKANTSEYIIPAPGVYQTSGPGGSGGQCDEFNSGGTGLQNSASRAAGALAGYGSSGGSWAAVDAVGPYCHNETFRPALPFAANLLEFYDSNQRGAARSCSEMPGSTNYPLSLDPDNIANNCGSTTPGDEHRSPGYPLFDHFRGALVNCPIPMGWYGTVEQHYADICQSGRIVSYHQWGQVNSSANCGTSAADSRVGIVLQEAQAVGLNPWLLLSMWATESSWGLGRPGCAATPTT